PDRHRVAHVEAAPCPGQRRDVREPRAHPGPRSGRPLRPVARRALTPGPATEATAAGGAPSGRGASGGLGETAVAVAVLGPLSVSVGGREVVISGARRRDVFI